MATKKSTQKPPTTIRIELVGTFPDIVAQWGVQTGQEYDAIVGPGYQPDPQAKPEVCIKTPTKVGQCDTIALLPANYVRI